MAHNRVASFKRSICILLFFHAGPLGDQALIKKLVPCVTCVDDSSHAFSLEECITLSDVDEFITCPKTSVRMPLQQVAPDVVMGDKRWLIEQRDLALVESRDFLLGDGGFGAVYRAKCRGKAVAVKVSILNWKFDESSCVSKVHSPNL